LFKQRSKASETDLNRNTIKRIKKEIVKTHEKFEILKEKFNKRIE